MNLWKRAGCQTESKAFEKSIAERIVREPGLGLLDPSEMDKKGSEFDLELTLPPGRKPAGGEREWN